LLAKCLSRRFHVIVGGELWSVATDRVMLVASRVCYQNVWDADSGDPQEDVRDLLSAALEAKTTVVDSSRLHAFVPEACVYCKDSRSVRCACRGLALLCDCDANGWSSCPACCGDRNALPARFTVRGRYYDRRRVGIVIRSIPVKSGFVSIGEVPLPRDWSALVIRVGGYVGMVCDFRVDPDRSATYPSMTSGKSERSGRE
jgi:hypothetical protein